MMMNAVFSSWGSARLSRALLAAGVVCAVMAMAPARAQSEASAALSLLPVASVVGTASVASAAAGAVAAVPAALSVGGAVLSVKAVEASAVGTVYLLERASDGAQVSVEVVGRGVASSAYAAGTVVTCSVIGTGVILSAAGEAIGFVPNVMGHGLALLAVALAVVATAPAHAGRSCESRKPVPPQVIERGMKLAEQTSAALDAEHARSGAQVVVLARAGQDLSKYGLRYSHMGWAYKTAEGPWRVAHKLNECGTAVGHLYRQGLGEFFLDDLWRYEAVYAVPTPEVQHRLLAVLQDKGRIRMLQHPPYSMVSYAWGRKYQQSNQWALETLAMAMEPATVR